MDFGFLVEESSEVEVEFLATRADLLYAKPVAVESAEPTLMPAEELTPTEATSSSFTTTLEI